MDADLMKRYHIILGKIWCGYGINLLKFKLSVRKLLRSMKTCTLFYPMTQMLNTVLIHDYKVIELFTLPLGLFSEEAPEAIKKVFKNFRESFTIKCDRKNIQFRPFSSNFIFI